MEKHARRCGKEARNKWKSMPSNVEMQAPHIYQIRYRHVEKHAGSKPDAVENTCGNKSLNMWKHMLGQPDHQPEICGNMAPFAVERGGCCVSSEICYVRLYISQDRV